MRHSCSGPILFLVLLAAGAPARESPESRKLDDYLQRCALHGWSGSALVARGDEVVLAAGYGLADRERDVPCAAETLFEIASATKQLTAAAILKLEEMGKLSTDDPIAKHLPRVPETLAGVTLYHLLTHTSGMPRTAGGRGGATLADAVQDYLSVPPANPPGTAFDYWNGGYALLAGVVETASAESYMDFCHQHLLAPAGLSGSGFTGEDDRLGKLPQAIGYDGDLPVRAAAGHPYGSYGWQYRGMGGMVTSVHDLWRWLRALQGDQVLGEAARAKLFKPFLSMYACGWLVDVSEHGTARISHGGDVRGFHCDIMYRPKEELAVIVLGNVEGIHAFEIVRTLECLAMKGADCRPQPPAAAELKSRERDAIAGTYTHASGARLEVIANGAAFRVRARGQLAADLLSCRGTFVSAGERFAQPYGLARQWVEAVAAGDRDALGAMLAPGIPPSWPDQLVGDLWKKHCERWGQLRQAEPVSCEDGGGGWQTIQVALEHEKGNASCEVGLQNGKLSRFALQDHALGVSAPYVPTSDSRLERHPFGDEPFARIDVERKGRKVVALLVVPAGGEEARFEARK